MSTHFGRIGPAPRIAVEWCGQGPLVVMLHGIGGNRGNWSAQLPAFGAHFTAVAWDARGYGDSDDYDGRLDFADFSADLLRVLDWFGAERAHLVGLSMGGRIALDFWQRHRGRVATLVLADTSAGSHETASPERVEEFLRLRKRPLLDGKTPADIAPEVARTMLGRSITVDAREAIVASLASLHTESYLKTLDTVTRYTSFPDFARTDVPVLVLVGEDDRTATPQYARQMASRIPNAQFVLLPRTGHLSNMENPDGFNAAVLPFLRRHQSRASSIAAPPPPLTEELRS